MGEQRKGYSEVQKEKKIKYLGKRMLLIFSRNKQKREVQGQLKEIYLIDNDPLKDFFICMYSATSRMSNSS